MRRLTGTLALALVLLLTCWSGLARAAGSEVKDEAHAFTPEQVASLQQSLNGLRYPYKVLILSSGFAQTPANPDAAMHELGTQLFQSRQVPQGAVFILIAMKERLITFEVAVNGPINAEFRQKTGQEFGAHTSAILEAYRTPARAGNVPEGILAAARVIDGLTATAAPAPSTTPAPSTSPAPAPTVPTPAPQPVPSPATAPTVTIDETYGPDPAILWWFGGAAGLGIVGVWVWRSTTYRRRRKEVLSLQAQYSSRLLALNEQELPKARKYQGEETRTCVEATERGLEKASAALISGNAHLDRAFRLSRWSRYGKAQKELDAAAAEYQAGSTEEAEQAWAPVAHALATGRRTLDDLRSGYGGADSAIAGEQMRTSWPLNLLKDRLAALRDGSAEADRYWGDDPVRAVRLGEARAQEMAVLQADIADLPVQEALLAQRKAERAEAERNVAEARQVQGLRFVEAVPEEHLREAERQEGVTADRLPVGDLPAARAALAAAGAEVQEAQTIVARYREALVECPRKHAALTAQVPALETDRRTGDAVIADLTARFAREDWADVAAIPGEILQLHIALSTGLPEVARLMDPSVQRLLEAHDRLNAWLEQRAEMAARLAALQAKPGQLEQAAGQALASQRAADSDLQRASQTVQADQLILPVDLVQALEQTQRELDAIDALRRTLPLPVGQWAARAEALVAAAQAGLRRVLEVQAEAAQARQSLANAEATAMRARSLSMYAPGHASQLGMALSASQSALSAGNYAAAAAQAQQAIVCCQMIESAYHAYLAEQERQRRAAEEAARQQQQMMMNSSNDNSSSFSSSSNDNNTSSGGTSGGGGSW